MEKLTTLITAIYCIALGFFTAYADNNFILITHTDPVWIYPYATSTAPKRVIQMIDERNIYSFKVIDDSLTRFKIQIYEPNISDEYASEALSDTGWIDKINATVYMGIHEYEDGRAYLRLYNEPTYESNFIPLAENDHHTMIGYVDKIYQDWYHISIIYDGILYSGWTRIYCSNPYGC